MPVYMVVGAVFGFLSAVGGGLIDSKLLSRRRHHDPDFSIGGPMLILAGIINSVVGAISVGVSLLTTGSLRMAFFLGLSVLIGFVVGFLVLAGLLIFLSRE